MKRLFNYWAALLFLIPFLVLGCASTPRAVPANDIAAIFIIGCAGPAFIIFTHRDGSQDVISEIGPVVLEAAIERAKVIPETNRHIFIMRNGCQPAGDST
jgi:hypothetical protein